ncbi:MAG: glycosyltransferase family 39 protein [bacterium]|nr:glycosyltransferase family 39 protein [bacterium]
MLLALAAGLLSAFVAPRTNRLYFDEHIYQNIGQTMALAGRAAFCNEGQFIYDEYHPQRLEYNKQPYGYPHLLSVVYRAAGVREAWAQVLNNVCAMVAVLLCFGLARQLTGSDRAGLLAAACMLILPEQLLWCNTAATEPSTACVAGLAMLAALWYCARPCSARLMFAVLCLAYAIYFRPEAVLLAPLFFLLILAVAPRQFAQPALWFAAAALMVLVTPQLLHIIAVRHEPWGSTGAKFTPAVVWHNLSTNGWFYLTNVRFPLLVTAGAALGMLTPWRRPATLVVLGWALVMWGVFLAFYAGSYDYGVDVRFALLSFMPLVVLAGIGLDWLCGVRPWTWLTACVVALLVLNGIQLLPRVRRVSQEGWAARHDVRYAREFARLVPPHALILTHNPNMFLLWGHSAAQMSLFSEQRDYFANVLLPRYPGGIYLHWNYWCNMPDQQQQFYGVMLTNHIGWAWVAEQREQDYVYALLRLTNLPPLAAAAPAPGPPPRRMRINKAEVQHRDFPPVDAH